MRSKWIAAAVTTALATGALTAGVSGATTRITDEPPTPITAPATVHAPADSITAETLVHLGPLGSLLTAVSDLIGATEPDPGTGDRDPRTMQERLEVLDTATRELRAIFRTDETSLTASRAAQDPAIPFARTADSQVNSAPSRLVTEESAELPLPNGLEKSLSALVKDAEALIKKAEESDGDETTVREAAVPMSRSALEILTSTLNGLSLI